MKQLEPCLLVLGGGGEKGSKGLPERRDKLRAEILGKSPRSGRESWIVGDGKKKIPGAVGEPSAYGQGLLPVAVSAWEMGGRILSRSML